MEFDIKVEIKIHGHHPCSEQKEGLRSLAAKPNRFHPALPERFQKTQQIRTQLLLASQAKCARNPLAALAGTAHTQCLRCVCGVGSLDLPQGLQASKARITSGTQLT